MESDPTTPWQRGMFVVTKLDVLDIAMFYYIVGLGGSIGVSVLAFYSDEPSSNPAGY